MSRGGLAALLFALALPISAAGVAIPFPGEGGDVCLGMLASYGLSVSVPPARTDGTYFDVHTGTEEPLLRGTVERGTRTFYLGGGSEAHVYRIVPPTGDPYIVRLFKKPFFKTYSSEIMDTMSDLQPSFPVGTFKVARYTNTTMATDAVRLNDVRGQTLDRLLESNDVPTSTKRFLEALFEARIRALEAHLLAQRHITAPFEAAPGDAGWRLTLTDPRTRVVHRFAILRQNIVVDPRTLDMTLIDPQ